MGLLYGAMLPMIARHPIRVRRPDRSGPVVWAAVLHAESFESFAGEPIDWRWFVASQMAFGVVAGLVVLRHTRVRTRENMPFAVRAGIEAPGMMPPRDEGDKRP